jgi:hypothetical protein
MAGFNPQLDQTLWQQDQNEKSPSGIIGSIKSYNGTTPKLSFDRIDTYRGGAIKPGSGRFTVEDIAWFVQNAQKFQQIMSQFSNNTPPNMQQNNFNNQNNYNNNSTLFGNMPSGMNDVPF